MQLLDNNTATLEYHLDALAVAARQMFAVLTREYQRLYAREIPTPDLLREKAHWAAELEQKQHQFQAFRETLGIEDLTTYLAALPHPSQKATINTQWQETALLFQNCDSQNAINGQLLHRLHVRNQLFGRILSNQLSDPTYSRQGQLADGRQGTLGHA
ncbi:MAG: flagellar export chaperone FlgN [Natronospirillum sp.]